MYVVKTATATYTTTLIEGKTMGRCNAKLSLVQLQMIAKSAAQRA